MRILPNRTDVVKWWRSNQNGDEDFIFIPEGQSNAFLGVIAGTSSPSVSVLDFFQVVRNLMAEHDLTYKEAFNYALDRANGAAAHGPLLVVTYPSQRPADKNFKHDQQPSN